ncbi:MAG: hypothetical protein GY949_04550 [Gammaproteobacteria bacterium]|nr:hypothetical protein [Gammaproteobacteria bacterium]
MKTPEERREWIEALHEKARGKSHFSVQVQAIHNALSGRNDKDSVLKIMTEVFDIEPVEKDGVYCLVIGKSASIRTTIFEACLRVVA